MSGHDMYPTLPGMASPEDIRALTVIPSPEIDKTFLKMMSSHHKGAVEMIQAEKQFGQYGETLSLAETLKSAQGKEAKTLSKLLVLP